MKKLIAVLASVCVISGAALMCSPKAHATQAPLYRCKITIGTPDCWAGGVDYQYAYSSPVVMNTNGTYYVYPAGDYQEGYIDVNINPTCCDEQVDLGNWTRQRSDNGGSSYYDYPAGNSNPVVMAGGDQDIFNCNNDGTLARGYVLTTCSGGGGGQ